MVALSKKVYLSKSAFTAFIDRAHSKHEEAGAYFRYFGEEQYKLFTDIVTLLEAYDEIYQFISPSLAKDFLRIIFLGNINIIYPDESDTKAALKALVNYKTTDLTFSQALLAILAERRGVSQICSFEYLHPLFGQSVFYLPL